MKTTKSLAVMAFAAAFAAGFSHSSFAEDGYVSTAANASGGKLYFDTGYRVKTSTRVELDCAATTSSGVQYFFDGSGVSNNRFLMASLVTYLRFYDFSATSKANDLSPLPTADYLLVRHTYVLDNVNLTAAVMTDGSTDWTADFDEHAGSGGATMNTLKLAASINIGGNYQYPASLKIYGCRIYEDDKLVRDFVPYINCGVPGLYDTVTGVFLTALGTGTLQYGGDIRCDPYPYIESDGTSAINSGYRLKGACSRVEFDMQLTTVTGAEYWRICGNETSDEKNIKSFVYITGGNDGVGTYTCMQDVESTDGGVSLNDSVAALYWGHVGETRRTLVLDLKNNLGSMITGATTNTIMFANDTHATGSKTSHRGVVADGPFALGGAFTSISAEEASSRCAKMRIYGFRAYEDEVLVHNFVPGVRDDGTAGLMDLVTGAFVTGLDPDAFTAGGTGLVTYDSSAPYVSTIANTNYPNDMLYFETGYSVKPTTRVELDCAATTSAGTQYFLDGSSGWYTNRFLMASPVSYLRFYDFSENSSPRDFNPMPANFQLGRHTYVIDNANLTAAVMTDGVADWTTTFAERAAPPSSSTIKLASSFAGSLNASLKIYGCKIYEDDKLVHDYVPCIKDGFPGLYDKKTGAFITAVNAAASGTGKLEYGGDIPEIGDACIVSDGSTGMSTGYRMKGGVSRVELDFALTTKGAAMSALLGDVGLYKIVDGNLVSEQHESNIPIEFNISGSPKGSTGGAFRFTGTDIALYWNFSAHVDLSRHTAFADLKSRTANFTGTAGGVQTFSKGFDGLVSALPLSLFGRYSDSTGTDFQCDPVTHEGNIYATSMGAKMRVYSVRFYENYVEGGENTPVRELIPYSKGGVVGFYDTVSGEIVRNENASAGAFTFHGQKVDGEFRAYVSSDVSKIKQGETATLTAYAPGAESYRWFRNGVEVTGETGDTLSVEWSDGGTSVGNGYVDTYTVKAVYSDPDGEAVESAESAAAAVKSSTAGTMIIVL